MERLADESDTATELEEIDRMHAKRRHDEAKQLEESNVQSMDKKGNVICDDCGIIIPKNRLKIVPFAVQCVDCKSINERIEKRFV